MALAFVAERCDPAVSERTYEAAMSWSRLRSTTPRVRDALESDSVRHLQHKLSEHLDEARRLDLLGDIIRIDRDRDPTTHAIKPCSSPTMSRTRSLPYRQMPSRPIPIASS